MPSPGPAPRLATLADLPRLQALLREAFPQPAWPGDDPVWHEAHVRELLSETRVYVLEGDDGALLATGTIDTRAHLRHLAVRGVARGRGLGSLLVGHLEAEAARAGARMMTLGADADNAPLARFYERCGFKSVGILHVPDGRRFHHFRKSLQGPLPPGVRRATGEDARALHELFMAAYRENEKLGLEFYAPAVSMERVERVLATSEVYVKEENGRIVASVALEPQVHVHRLSVSPEARGRGLAQDLVDVAMVRAAGMGASKATLEIDGGHPWLAGFYEARGFVEQGTLVYDPGTGDEFRTRLFNLPLRAPRPEQEDG